MRGEVIKTSKADALDVEAAFYPETNVLCFQPHPEFNGVSECCALYFSYLERFFNLGFKTKEEDDTCVA
jgi:hypothetical protein